MLIDIGGGSVEVTISENQNMISTESYNMGTVRLLQKLDGGGDPAFSLPGSRRPFSLLVREYAEAARRRIDRELGNARVNVCVGTGGTVEELGRLRQKVFKQQNEKLITLSELQDLIEELSGMSVKERIRKFKLRPDRADVILPGGDRAADDRPRSACEAGGNSACGLERRPPARNGGRAQTEARMRRVVSRYGNQRCDWGRNINSMPGTRP